MTAYSSKGTVTRIAIESTFGTDPGASYLQVRNEGDPQVGNPSSQSVTPNTAMSNVYDGEKPIKIDLPVEGFNTIKSGITMAATPGQDSTNVTLLKSAGWTEVGGSADTTVASVTDIAELVLTADIFGANTAGVGIIIELNDGTFYPALVMDYVLATKTCQLAMDLPSATTAGKNVYKCHTMTPGLHAEVGTSLTTEVITNAEDGSSNNITARGRGGSVAAISDMLLKHGEVPYWEFTVNVGIADFKETTTELPANSFQDSEAKQVVDMPLLGMATASASGKISESLQKFMEGTVMIGPKTQYIMATGDGAGVSGVCGHMVDVADENSEFKIQLKVLWDQTMKDAWEGTNPSKYIAFSQPSSASTTPAFAFIMPNSHQVGQPEHDFVGDTTIQSTYTFAGRPAGYDGTTEGSQGNQPFYYLSGTLAS